MRKTSRSPSLQAAIAMGALWLRPGVAHAYQARSPASNAFGWALIIGTAVTTFFIARWYNRRAGARTVSGAPLTALLPPEIGASFDGLHIDWQKRSEGKGGATVLISPGSTTGTVRQSVRYYKVVDFAFSVQNRSAAPLRVQLDLSLTNAEGYSTADRWMAVDLPPGGKKRVSFGLEMRDVGAFQNLRVSGLHAGAPGHQRYAFSARPDLPFRTLLEFDKAALFAGFPASGWKLLAIAFAMAVVWAVALKSLQDLLSL